MVPSAWAAQRGGAVSAVTNAHRAPRARRCNEEPITIFGTLVKPDSCKTEPRHHASSSTERSALSMEQTICLPSIRTTAATRKWPPGPTSATSAEPPFASSAQQRRKTVQAFAQLLNLVKAGKERQQRNCCTDGKRESAGLCRAVLQHRRKRKTQTAGMKTCVIEARLSNAALISPRPAVVTARPCLTTSGKMANRAGSDHLGALRFRGVTGP